MLTATGGAARRLRWRLHKLLSDEKLGFIDFAWMFTLRGVPAVFFAAKGARYRMREVQSGQSDGVTLEFDPGQVGATK
jgi:hypothetical protein